MTGAKISRQEKAQQTKELIFGTAVRLIKEAGYSNVSVSKICQEAKVAKGTFYVHYKTKEDIIRESYYSDMSVYMEQEYAAYVQNHQSADVVTRLRQLVQLEFQFAVYAGYELTCLAYAMNLSACVPGPCDHFARRSFSHLLLELIEEGQQTGKLTLEINADEIFWQLETSIRGMMATWCFANGEFDIRQQGERYMARVLQGYLA